MIDVDETFSNPVAEKASGKKKKRIRRRKLKQVTAYRVLTTAQPAYLYELISVESPGSTRSSPVITITLPLFKITNRSFQYASPCLWNQRPAAFYQHAVIPF